MSFVDICRSFQTELLTVLILCLKMWCQLSATILTSGIKEEDLIMANAAELTWEHAQGLNALRESGNGLVAADYS